MTPRRTHGWCPSCREDSAIDIERNCLWCGGPTQEKRRGGGKPAGVWGKLEDRHLRALHVMHQEQGVPIRELGRRIWVRAGFASEKSAANSISYGFKRLSLPALSQPEATARANEARRAKGSPGTSDRAAHKRWRRKRDGGYRMCQGVKSQAPRKGEPCSRYALVGSDYCYNHDPARRAEIVAHTAEMRELIGAVA